MNVRHFARHARRWLLVVAPFALLLFTTGCATVRAYQRERLADRIMSLDADARQTARRIKSLDAREGSTGGNGGAGGGCACN
jgi:hypothetical protein